MRMRRLLALPFRAARKFYRILKEDLLSDQLNYSHDRIRALILASRVNSKLERFRYIHEGKNIYIIGTGPTEKYFTPLNKSDDKDKNIFIGINMALRDKSIKFDYLFCQDDLQERLDEFADYGRSDTQDTGCLKFLAVIPGSPYYAVTMVQAARIKGIRYVLDSHTMGHIPDDITLEPFADLHGTVFSALQFALFTNPDNIYLVGIDCSAGGDVFLGNNEDFGYQYKSWLYLSKFLKKNGLNEKIISINPVRLKNLFKDLYTREYVKANPDLKLEIERGNTAYYD